MRVEIVLSWIQGGSSDGTWAPGTVIGTYRGQDVTIGGRYVSRTMFDDVPPGAQLDRFGIRLEGSSEFIVDMTCDSERSMRRLAERSAYEQGIREGRRRERRRIRRRLRKVLGL